jgi:hypothetical protein
MVANVASIALGRSRLVIMVSEICRKKLCCAMTIVSFGLSAIDGAGLKEGPLAASSTQLAVIRSCLVSQSLVLGSC